MIDVRLSIDGLLYRIHTLDLTKWTPRWGVVGPQLVRETHSLEDAQQWVIDWVEYRRWKTRTVAEIDGSPTPQFEPYIDELLSIEDVPWDPRTLPYRFRNKSKLYISWSNRFSKFNTPEDTDRTCFRWVWDQNQVLRARHQTARVIPQMMFDGTYIVQTSRHSPHPDRGLRLGFTYTGDMSSRSGVLCRMTSAYAATEFVTIVPGYPSRFFDYNRAMFREILLTPEQYQGLVDDRDQIILQYKNDTLTSWRFVYRDQ